MRKLVNHIVLFCSWHDDTDSLERNTKPEVEKTCIIVSDAHACVLIAGTRNRRVTKKRSICVNVFS